MKMGNAMTQVVEILQYRLKAGSGERFHTIMQEHSVPLHNQAGLKKATVWCCLTRMAHYRWLISEKEVGSPPLGISLVNSEPFYTMPVFLPR